MYSAFVKWRLTFEGCLLSSLNNGSSGLEVRQPCDWLSLEVSSQQRNVQVVNLYPKGKLSEMYKYMDVAVPIPCEHLLYTYMAQMLFFMSASYHKPK